MSFFKGLLNFATMLVLGICLMIWLTFGLLNHSILSIEENQNMLQKTDVTEEIVDEMLSRYHMSLNELRFERDVLIRFVNESAIGSLEYVFLEKDEMPKVDVEFLKDYIVETVEAESSSKMQGNVNFDELLTVLRTVPEGESVTVTVKQYIDTLDLNIDKSEIEAISQAYIDNKDLDDLALTQLLVNTVAYEVLNLDDINTELSLQSLFDKLTDRNPFTLLRTIMTSVNKDVKFYLPITIVLLILLIAFVEFRVSSASIWLALAMIIAIVPLQLIRLADFFIQQDILDIVGGLGSYKTYMMSTIVKRLNVITIIFVVLIIILFVLSKVFRNKLDNKIENMETTRHSRVTWVHVIALILVVGGLILNTNAARRYNTVLVNEIKSIQPSDFDPNSVDLILREELNVDFDF